MKRLSAFCVVLVVATILSAPTSARANSTGTLGFGLRHHTTHSIYTDYPFEEGDMSYGIAYEYNDAAGYWQLAVDYAANTAGGQTNSADYVVTPQLNLVIRDSFWRIGVGILGSYIEYEDDVVEASEEDDDPDNDLDNGWTDIYYQILAGVSLPLGGMTLDILAAYPFEDWGEVEDFDADDLEIALWLKFNL
jgi:hypothetical protein